MAKIEKETVITSYSGSVFKRLFDYMKPYSGRFIVAIIMIFVVTAFELIRPMLIAQAIDTYIEGYDRTYAIVDETEADLSYEGLFLTKDFKENEVVNYCQIVLCDEEYYYFENLNIRQVQLLVEKNDAGIKDEALKTEMAIIIAYVSVNLLKGNCC